MLASVCLAPTGKRLETELCSFDRVLNTVCSSCLLSVIVPSFEARICAVHVQTFAMATNGSAKPFQRLPKAVVPDHYDIHLKPDLVALTFTGTQSVHICVHEKTEKIVLHAADLVISEASYKSDKTQEATGVTFDLNVKDELLTIGFDNPINPGMGILKMSFTGSINDKRKGLYRSKYTLDGEERFAAVTQFEATDARRCFPCWDEPAIKATFDITLEVPKNRVALSNCNVISETDSADADLKIVKYAKTPKMSTYLVAVVVGEYDYVESKTADGVQVRVYTPVGKKEQGLFPLDLATRALDFYRNFFDIPYPLPKLDMIAISDFEMGAMENWGLVTYREARLLVDPNNTSSGTKQDVALVVGHELAHQWFGNLVTMEWWTHLWLNEGYAKFSEYLCVDHLLPEYNIWTQFVARTFSAALDLDALHNSHPIEVAVGHPDDVNEIFDNISYAKGASVIRMLNKYLGDEAFRTGMSNYLNKHKYSNTQTEDLWAALEEASGKPVGEVMSTWTKQKGFPVISVTQRQDGNSRVLVLKQEKFCADGKLPKEETNTTWMVPITISSSASPAKVIKEVLLTEKLMEVTVDNVRADQWIKLNVGTVGVYRVQYETEMLNQLLPAIEDRSLPPLDRLALQSDLFALVQAGRVPTVDAIKLIGSFVNETDYTVWASINSALGKLNLVLSHTDFQESYHVWGRRLLAKIYARLGWEPRKDEGHGDTLLRPLVIGRLIAFDDQEVIAEARKRFDGHVNGTSLIPADLRLVVYRAVAKSIAGSDDKAFEQLLKTYRETELQEEKNRVLVSLGVVKDSSAVARVLDFAISDEVRDQNSYFVISSVAASKHGRDAAWQFFKDKEAVWRERYEGGALMARLVAGVTENFASEEMAVEVEEYFKKSGFSGTERTVQQSLESIRLQKEWLARDAQHVKDFIAKQIAV